MTLLQTETGFTGKSNFVYILIQETQQLSLPKIKVHKNKFTHYIINDKINVYLVLFYELNVAFLSIFDIGISKIFLVKARQNYSNCHPAKIHDKDILLSLLNWGPIHWNIIDTTLQILNMPFFIGILMLILQCEMKP